MHKLVQVKQKQEESNWKTNVHKKKVKKLKPEIGILMRKRQGS
jgi:hypothetical protein